jgi:hypothetical protein
MNERNESPRTNAGGIDNPKTFSRWVIPGDIVSRIGLLFVALSFIKLAMLAGFRGHLFEIHWRLDKSAAFDWVNKVAFLGFATLVTLNLWQLGSWCLTRGIKTVRAANACVFLIGVFFLFLTVWLGGRHYFSALMTGTGSLRELGSAFFSEPPYWSVWILIYAMFYFVFARVGLESQTLRVTAVLAGIYTALLLRPLIINHRDALLVCDCTGIACLLAGRKSQRSPGWFWLIQPCIWILFFILIFRGQADVLTNLSPQFIVLTAWMTIVLIGTSALAGKWKLFPGWSWLLPFAMVSSLLLVNIDYDYATNYQNLLSMGLMLPHYLLGEFLLAFVLLMIAIIYRHFLPSSSLIWLDVIILLLITFSLADLRLTQIMGIRLDWQAIKIAGGPKMMWLQAKPYLPDMVFGVVMLGSVYAILMGFLKRAAPQMTLRLGNGEWFFLIAFMLLGITGKIVAPHDKAEGESAILLAETSPLFNWSANTVMNEQAFIGTARQLEIEQMLARPPSMATRSQRDLNVVLIFQESSYNQYLSLFSGTNNTEPLLSKYKNRMELFPNFFSDFPGSINARFATLSGLYPVQDFEAFTFHHVGVKSILDVLHDYGYTSSVFDSASLDYTDFRDFLRGRGLDTVYDADTMPGRDESGQVSWGIKEEVTLKAIQSQIKEYAANHKKFFLSYFPVAPHNPFDGIPPQFLKFPASKKSGYAPQYKDSLLYLDWVISSIVDQLKSSGLLDNTLVIITDDHGEMLGENGGPIGHGWAVTPRLTNIPLIIMDPANPGYHINDTIGSQVDLLPTMLDLLGIPLPQDQLYQGTSLYSPMAQNKRMIYLDSFEQYGLLEGNHLLCGNKEVGSSDGTNSLSLKYYAITNDGARTFFPKLPPTTVAPPSITQFDKFQESFLQNYPYYVQMIRSTSPSGN